jgi:hypothetical protein
LPKRREFNSPLGRVGDFDSKDEFECACWLDVQAQQGRIQFWVHNLVRREGSFKDRVENLPNSVGVLKLTSFKPADLETRHQDLLARLAASYTLRQAT